MRYDVAIVGAGNAALCAAHAAAERGARVLVLEKAPRHHAGGNSYFTAGAIRIAHNGLSDLHDLLTAHTAQELANVEIDPYSAQDYQHDMMRVTEGRCDPVLTQVLVDQSAEAVRWLAGKGIKWRLMFERQAYGVNGIQRFWGGLVLGTVGGGAGLVHQHLAIAERAGIDIRYECVARELIQDNDGRICGLVCATPHGQERINARAVVLASGGFEADPRLRAMYLGPRWDLVKVRGTPYNTGDGIMMALGVGAQAYGHWSGCHSIAWDASAPATGNWELTNRLSKQSYPLGIVVNQNGVRFVDEGADFRNYTYAKYGAEIMQQPGSVAFQIFDAKTEPLLREEEYSGPGVSRFQTDTIDALAEQAGIDANTLQQTVHDFNQAIQPGTFDPTIKDGKRTAGITPPKSNWAQPIDTPPFLAFKVTCGITFTFGGLKIDTSARVLDRSDCPIPGLFAAGELVGGLFYHNYPGGAGLASGAVFGRIAGTSATV